MSKEPLTKEEWVLFLENHWKHMIEDMASVKANVKWLTWLIGLLVAGVIGYIIKDFIGGLS
jgi:hypothetical protein